MAATISRLGKLAPAQSALFVCDIQERFRPLINGMPAVIDTARRMVKGANLLGVPVLVTEQNPARLGATVPELQEHLTPDSATVAKTLFSMVTPEVGGWLTERHRNVKQVLLVGIETHVCVLQTTLDLIERGYEVHVVVDGVSSQRAQDRITGLARMAQSGAFMVTSEMALFQLLQDAKAAPFKAVSKMVQEEKPGDVLGLHSPLSKI